MLDVAVVQAGTFVDHDRERHRESWPYPPTKLERLAAQAGVHDFTLRTWLYGEIERRRAEAPGEVRDVAAVAGAPDLLPDLLPD